MLKQEITFINYDDNEETETHYFNISKGELAKMKMTFEAQGGLEGMVASMLAKKDADSVMALFESILEMAYGVRSEDGKRFHKSPELFAEFKSSPAYSELYYKLCTDAGFGAEFLTGCLPKDVRDKAKELDLDVASGMKSLEEQLKAVESMPPKEVTSFFADNRPSISQHFQNHPPSDAVARGVASVDVNLANPFGPTVDNTTERSPKASRQVFDDEQRLGQFAPTGIRNEPKKLEDYTHGELINMPMDQFEELVAMYKGTVPRSVLNIAFQRKLAQGQNETE